MHTRPHILDTYARVMAMQGVTMTMNSHTRGQKVERRRYKRTLYWFGFIEIILGIASCSVCIVGLVIASVHWKNSMISTSSGLWCGIFLIFSGIAGVRVNRQSSACIIRINMALSIISCIFMCVMFIMSILAAFPNVSTLLAVYVFLSIIASAGFIINIVHAAFCCAAICCIPKRNHGQVFYSSGRPQLVELGNGQYILIQGESLVPPGYPGPPSGGNNSEPIMPALLHPPPSSPQSEEDPNKRISTPPPPYTSREDLSAGPSNRR
ncbi:uncharacterized protein LOC120328779 [Styela clava]|uniref:uncharacterized protein LOC120328779 n=1 Tax=Styela clava TaxID=7725 RepID=UPI001939EB65|nr:uncharacterized protein LOC120328779 [Styela clava]